MARKTRKTRLDYAAAIERLRRERSMTRDALAEASGVSASYLSEVERGFKRPSTDVLAKVAVALGMAPSELLAVVEDSSDRPVSEVARFDRSPAPESAARAKASDLLARVRARRTAGIEPPEARRSWLASQLGVYQFAQEPERPKEQLLQTLITESARLDADDLQVLVELARRLAEKRA